MTVAFRIFYPDRTAAQIRKLDRQIMRRVLDRIERLALDPRAPGSVRLEGHSDLYRVRVGDYRIVYRIDDAREMIEITVVAHRREVYRDL